MMSEKTVKNVSGITVHMIVPEAADKRLKIENDITSKILSNMAHEFWSEMQSAMGSSSNLKAVKIAVNEQGYMDITTITQDQWMSDGCAPPVTTNGTQSTERD